MLYCPKCKSEYEAGSTVCADCRVDLVSNLPEFDHSPPVLALHATTFAEARVAKATLEAEGIPAFVASDDGVLEMLEPGYVSDETVDLDVMVPADRADEARAVLSMPPLSEDELAEAAGFEPESDQVY